MNNRQGDGSGCEATAAVRARQEDEGSSWVTTWVDVRHTAEGLVGLLRGADLLEWKAPLEMLVDVMDGGDPLLAFMAMQALRDTLARITNSNTVSTCVRQLLHRPLERPSGARFQLLRQLIRPLKATEGDEPDDQAERESSDDDEDHEARSHQLFLACILRNLYGFERLVEQVLSHGDSSADVVHDALLCLSDIVKRVSTRSKLEGDAAKLSKVVLDTVRRVSASALFSERTMPSFVACAVIDLVLGFQVLETATASWLSAALTVLMPERSIAQVARHHLLGDSVGSTSASAESFVGSCGPYPLLQKWLLLGCVALVDLLSQPQPDLVCAERIVSTFPRRQRLMSILMEQDDILIEVVLQLLQLARRLQLQQSLPVSVQLKHYFEDEVDPDCLFADLLRNFGDDHLVVLDMLMASETRMLEYVITYLRDLGESWPRSHRAWNSISRTEAVMSVLIRLRLEIERLNKAGVFPYNPKPLLRRLEAIESLYEDDEA